MKVFFVRIVIFGVSPPSCFLISPGLLKHHNSTDSKTVCTFNILRSLPTVVVKMRSKSCPDGSFAIFLVKTRTICCSYSLLILHFCFVLRLIWEVQSYFLLTALTGVLFALDIPSFLDCQFFTPSDQLYSETVGCVCVWGGGVYVQETKCVLCVCVRVGDGGGERDRNKQLVNLELAPGLIVKKRSKLINAWPDLLFIPFIHHCKDSEKKKTQQQQQNNNCR